MLNKPKFMSPSLNMQGNTVIDLDLTSLPFSCIVDGNEAITSWQIIIAKLEDNVIVFDSGEIDISNDPFFPINSRNQNVVFSRDLKELENYEELATNFINRPEPYYWQIKLVGKSGTITTSAEEVFYANSTPTTTIKYSYTEDDWSGNSTLSKDAKLNKRKVFFKAIYTQEENVPLKRYGWRLTDTNTNTVVFDTITQNQIYGVADNILCECNGLVNGNSYSIELFVETQNGYFAIVQAIDFDVVYDVVTINADFEVVAANNTSGIILNWGNLKTTEGVVEGEDISLVANKPIVSYDLAGNPNGSMSIEIPENSSVVFDETVSGKSLEIDENSYVVLSVQIDKTKDMIIFEMTGTDASLNKNRREVKYYSKSHSFGYNALEGGIYKIGLSRVVSDTNGERCWYVITIPPIGDVSNFKVFENVTTEPVIPSESLYPSNTLYPSSGKWALRRG